MSKLWQRLLRQRMQVSAPPASGYRYFRFTVDTGKTRYLVLREVSLALSVGGENILTPATPVTSPQANAWAFSGTGISGLTDGRSDLITRNDTSMADAGYPLQTDFDLGSVVAPKQFGYYNGTGTTNVPTAISFHGSNDGVVFTELARFSGIKGWAIDTWKYFTIP